MAGETQQTSSFDRSKLEGDGTGSQKYYQERREKAQSGEPTWIVRSFDGEDGRVYDFLVDGAVAGWVINDYGYGCSAYTGVEGEISLSEDPLDIETAVHLIEDYVAATT